MDIVADSSSIHRGYDNASCLLPSTRGGASLAKTTEGMHKCGVARAALVD